MAILRSREPANLGRLSSIDPLKLEPGMIIWDRFCVVGKVRHASPLWSVPVTDLEREFGRPPHHRVSLQYLPIAEGQRERIRRAVIADEDVQPRVRATIELPHGMTLIHEPVTGERLGAQLPARESRALALSLTSLLNRLHEAKVRGIGLRVSALRQSEGRFRLDGFGHLCGAGTIEQDVEGLTTLLRRLSGQHLGDLLQPPATDAAELWTRARTLARDHGAATTPLSQHPPFVGRDDARRELERAYSDAQIARSSLTLVCGGQGIGKSRLLEEFASWVRANERAVVLRGEYLRGCGESRAGLMGALGQLPQALASWPDDQRDRVQERMSQRTGPLTAVLAGYAPSLADLLHLDTDAEPDSSQTELPSSEFEEGIARHAVAVAEGIRAIGSQTRPLVILLDNLQLADRGSVAILRRLLLEDRSHHTMIVAGLCGAAPPGLADTADEGNWNPKRDPQLLLRRIELEAMTSPELERLIVAGLPGPVARPLELAEALLETSRGNPLVTWATLQAWIDSEVLSRNEAEPWTLHRRKISASSPKQVFAQRVEQASLDERWLGLLAAVAGGHVDEAWFQRVSDWTPARVGAAVAGLEHRGLMGKAGEASFRFPHELVRDLIIDGTPPEELRRAHAKIAAWLASIGPRVSPARLAYHTDRALGQASTTDPQLAEMHLAAGREMLGVFDLERSGWHFTRALVERSKGGARLAAIEGAADVALLGEKYDDAAQYYAEAVLEAEDALVASRIAAKAVHGLYRKSAASEAASIGRLALARADRPLPEPGLRLRTAKFEAKLRLAMKREPELSEQLREQLCWLYARMAVVLSLPDPQTGELCLLRALRHARGLERAAAANVFALHGVNLATRGKLDEGRQLIDQAIELAARVGNDWALAMAQHLRGHLVELPRGDYRQGLASLDQAVTHFRRTGDLSVAVSSLFFKAVYSRDRASLPILHGWLDEATALNEVQGDAIVDLAIDALRLLLRARAGARNIVEAVANVAARAAKRELVSYEAYLSYAYLSLALLEVGEQGRGRELIDIAMARAVEHDQMPDFAYDLWIAQATILARTRSNTDKRRLDETLRMLDKASHNSPRLVALTQVVRMRQALAAGKRERAQAAAEVLISGFVNHGQAYLALEAHQTLGELLRGTDVLAAREHVHLARGLAEELGLEQARERERERERAAEQQDVPRPRPHDRSSRRHSNAYLRALARNELVDVAEVLEGSRQVLLETLGNVPWLYLRAKPHLRVFGELLELQSLLVHLALCARDSVIEPEQLRAIGTLEELDPTRASQIPGASAGVWGRIAVTVIGPPTSSGVTGGVTACRQVATRLGGFLEVEQADDLLSLCVYLPPERGSKPSSASGPSEAANEAELPRYEGVYVLHPDPIIRETLTSAVSRLGFDCQDSAPDDLDFRDLPPVQVLFADADTLGNYAAQFPHVPRIVELGSRIIRPGSKYPNLRVPFALGELRKLLEFE